MAVCIHCDRTFLNKEALLQHVNNSGLEHPFCAPCQRRFISHAACDAVSTAVYSVKLQIASWVILQLTVQHMAAKHPVTYDCTVCNRAFPAPFALDDHYRGSPSHPNCFKCGRGFKNLTERDEVCLCDWYFHPGNNLSPFSAFANCPSQSYLPPMWRDCPIRGRSW